MSGGKIDAESLKGLVPIIKTAMEEVRNICTDLRPSTLDSLGLIATIKWLCREFNSSYKDISVELSIAIQEDRVPQSLRVPIFRILQESLNNISKHSEADSVQIYFGLQDGHIRLTVEDNGSGVDLKNLLSLEDGRRGFGIPSMRQRTEYSRGSFSIESMEGKGTSVQVSWPITA
jgi:signal transduction histidine kinase